MKLMPIVQKAMHLFRGSFINHNNELILIPKFNVYFLLDDVNTEEDFFCKMCEWVSRDCSCAMRYKDSKRLERYWEHITYNFNQVCGTNFSVNDMEKIYAKLGNSCNHFRTVQFVQSGFDLSVLGVDD